MPTAITIELRPGKTAAQKLRDREVDAIFSPRVPKEFENGEPWIRRLFPDCQAEVQRLTRLLGYVPMSHTIVMKKELAERQPWIATSLYQAFVAAQKSADECCQIEKMLSYVETRCSSWNSSGPPTAAILISTDSRPTPPDHGNLRALCI